MHVADIVRSLSATASLNEKERILTKHKDDPGLQLFFKYATEPLFKYNIKKYEKKDVNPILHSKEIDSILEMQFLFDGLNAREYTGNAAKVMVENAYASCTSDVQYLFAKILAKDPDCGVSEGLISRVWPNLLSEMPKLCKAQAYSTKAISKIKFPAISELKVDGARVLAFITKKSVRLVSSGGLELHKLNFISSELIDTWNGTDCVIDGEMVVLDTDMKTILSRKKGNGIITKAIKNTISPEESNRVRFIVWDIIPMDVYNEKRPSNKYIHRRNDLAKAILNCSRIIQVDSRIVNSIEEAIEHFKQNLQLGLEGTVLKNVDFLWEDSRSDFCVKFKLEIVTTLRCIGIKMSEDTKYAGMIGSLILESEEGTVVVSAGSGLEDSERKLYTEVSPIGLYFDIKSNGLISDESGWSLYLPRVIEERADKKKADDFKLIAQLSYQKIEG